MRIENSRQVAIAVHHALYLYRILYYPEENGIAANSCKTGCRRLRTSNLAIDSICSPPELIFNFLFRNLYQLKLELR